MSFTVILFVPYSNNLKKDLQRLKNGPKGLYFLVHHVYKLTADLH